MARTLQKETGKMTSGIPYPPKDERYVSSTAQKTLNSTGLFLRPHFPLCPVLNPAFAVVAKVQPPFCLLGSGATVHLS